jgi:Domain of unknown function (DUF4184)
MCSRRVERALTSKGVTFGGTRSVTPPALYDDNDLRRGRAGMFAAVLGLDHQRSKISELASNLDPGWRSGGHLTIVLPGAAGALLPTTTKTGLRPSCRMPFTLFAHQAPVLPLKIARPLWVDGTAVCIGSMAPDLCYAVSSYVHVDTHDVDGMPLVIAATLVLTMLVRFVAVDVVAAHLPDLGEFRLWSWRAIARRKIPIGITLASALVGVATHIGLDAFTHPGRPGVRWLGYDDVYVTVLGHRRPLAGVFQLIGHAFGTWIGVVLLFRIGRRRLIESWHGDETVQGKRTFRLPAGARSTFVVLVTVGGVCGIVWGWNIWYVAKIERLLVGLAAGAVTASLLRRCRPVS